MIHLALFIWMHVECMLNACSISFSLSPDGVLAVGWGSGTATFPYLVSPLEAIQRKAIEEDQIINWWLDNWNLVGAASTAAYQDVALVVSISLPKRLA